MPNAVTPAKYGNVRALFVYQEVHRALQTDYLRAVRSEVGRRERLVFKLDRSASFTVMESGKDFCTSRSSNTTFVPSAMIRL